MRKACLAVIPVVLLAAGPLLAQHPPATYSTWAANHPNGVPAGTGPVQAVPIAIVNVPIVQPAPMNSPQPGALNTPNASNGNAPAASSCGNGQCQHALQPIDWRCLRDWLCYQPLKGGCNKHGSCGCNCSVPLYVYFLGTCKEGRKYELPPCAAGCDSRPSVFRQMLQDGRGLVGSVNLGRPCASGDCLGGTGHRFFGMMTGH